MWLMMEPTPPSDVIFHTIRQAIINTSRSTGLVLDDLIFSDINPQTGKKVIDALSSDGEIECIYPR